MTEEEKQAKRAELKALFEQTGLRGSKVIKDLGLGKATVYRAVNPAINAYVSESVLNKIEQYLKSKL